MKKVGIGITGSGFMGLTHAEAASSLSSTHLVAVACGSRAPKLAEDYGVTHEPTVEALVRNKEVDAIIFATPHFTHFGEAMAAIEQGKHVLVEKPLATSVSDCDRMIAAARANGVILSVAYHQRFRTNNVRARQLIREGLIGKILTVQANMCYSVESLQADGTHSQNWAWWNDPASVGFIINSGPHAIDLLRWFMDTEVAEVSAFSRTFRPQSPVEDTTVALINFANGTIGSLISTCIAPKPNFPSEEFHFRIIGSKGLMDLDPYGNLDVTIEKVWQTVQTQPPVEMASTTTFLNPIRMQSYMDQLNSFVETIHGRVPQEGTGLDGRAGVEACLSMLEASRKSSVIQLHNSQKGAANEASDLH